MTLGILRIFGIIFFLYLTWRNLKDDHPGDKLIAYSWIAMIFFIIFGRIGFGLIHWGSWDNFTDWISVWSKPGMSYIVAYLGIIGVTFWYCKIQDWKFFSLVESNLSAILTMMIFMMGDEILRSRIDLKPLLYLLSLVAIFVISGFIGKRYRSFVWYRSGKKGFTFLFSNFLMFLLLGIIFLLTKDSLVNLILALVISLISLTGLFILGEVKRKV